MVLSDNSRIYEDLMRFRPDDLTPNAWAVKAGVSRTVWNDMRRHGNPSRRTLEKLLAVADSSLAEFEALRIGDEVARPTASRGVGERRRREWPSAPLPTLPLLHSQAGGEWGASQAEVTEVRFDEKVGEMPRPGSLAADTDAFALTVVGDSMWPRFRPGRRVAVSPRSPVSIGDDVLVRLKGGGIALALLKELVRHGGDRVELRQFNPDRTFTVDPADIEAIYKVFGEII